MYILKNAWKSIVRSKGRNILIGIIVVMIAVSSCIALAIRNSADKVVENFKNTNDITASVEVDRQAMMKDAQSSGKDIRTAMSSIPSLTLANIKKYGASSYLKGYYYTIQASLNSSTIDPVDTNSWSSSSSTTSSSTSSANKSQRNDASNDNNVGGQMRKSFGDFRLTGYSSTAAMTDFVSGTNKVTSGSMFTDSETGNVCVISNELAQLNKIAVGNTITFTNPNDATKTYSFKVVGIYTSTSSSSSNDGMVQNALSDSANNIITNFTALNKIITASQSSSTTTSSSNSTTTDTSLRSQLSATFVLKNSNSVDGFKADLTKMGLNKYFTVTTNLDSFKQSLTPLNNLSSFATAFLIIVLIIGSIILIVLNLINIRERKYEVGVLRAIGMKKHNVAFQFITELLIVTFISLMIGSGIGAAASVPTASYMLKNQISAQQSQQQQVSQNFGRQGENGGQTQMTSGRFSGMNNMFGLRSNSNYVTQINAVINAKILLQIALIGLVLVLFSSSVAVIFISRYEPLKILSNRS